MEALVLTLPESIRFTDDELFEFCVANPDLRIERDKSGKLKIMSPTGSLTGHIHFRLYTQVAAWYVENEWRGYLFDATAGFLLPDRSVLVPDLAYVSREKWDALTESQKEKFAPVCPEFVVEIRSKTDLLTDLQQKMKQWMSNGCELAWLIDPVKQQAWVYKKNETDQSIDDFKSVLDGEPVLPGLRVDLSKLIG